MHCSIRFAIIVLFAVSALLVVGLSNVVALSLFGEFNSRLLARVVTLIHRRRCLCEHQFGFR